MRSFKTLSLLSGALALLLQGAMTLAAPPAATSPAHKETTPCARCGKTDCSYTVGINLAGPEFGSAIPGEEGKNYGWPTAKSLDYWKSKGVRLIRLPFKWERLQPTLSGDFDPQYAGALKRTVEFIQARDMQVILDLHNYGRYGNELATPSGKVSFEAFADVWRRLAEAYKDYPCLWGYGLMNEPANKDVNVMRQMGIDAIRKVDTRTRILLACDGQVKAWASRKTRPGALDFKDPSDNLWFENHFYFDSTGSGKYDKTYEQEVSKANPIVSPTIGVERATQFRDFLKEFKLKGMVGEYGVPANPDNDPRWLEALDKAAAFMRDNCIASTYWAGGEYWTPGRNYVIDPVGWKDPKDREAMKDRPQLEILTKYMEAPRK